MQLNLDLKFKDNMENCEQCTGDCLENPCTPQGSVCPCTLVTPCSYACSCANGVMSGGCSRCASYGSKEQQLAAANRLMSLTELPVDRGTCEGGKPVILLKLSEYELVNLYEALGSAIAEQSPLSALNTGDWLGALFWRIQAEKDRFNITYAPNMKRTEMIKFSRLIK